MFSAGTLVEWSKLGASIYAVINNGGDTDSAITNCVALFMEHDDLPIDQQLTCWEGIMPPPTIQNYTGGSSIHQFWVGKQGLDPDRWRELTKLLINVFHSDPAVCNPSRLMRLPGYRYFDKQGNPGGICSIVNQEHPTYDIDELEAALRKALPAGPTQSIGRGWKPSSSNSDWEAAKPCPICGRDLDDKCRITADGTFIQCHLGDTFAPPEQTKGKLLKGHDGNQWK